MRLKRNDETRQAGEVRRRIITRFQDANRIRLQGNPLVDLLTFSELLRDPGWHSSLIAGLFCWAVSGRETARFRMRVVQSERH